MIIEKNKQEEGKVRYLVKLKNDKFFLNIYIENKYDGSKNVDINEVSEFKYGDVLKVKGKLYIPENLGNIGEFNYIRYLNSESIHGIINSYNVEYLDNIGNTYIKTIFNIKEKISNIVNKNLDKDESELLKGMVYGDTKDLNNSIKEDFSNIGISYIVAVSGMHLNIVLYMFEIFLYKVKKHKKIYFLLQLFFIISFCIISGFKLSIIRASIMNIIFLIYKYKGKDIYIEKVLLVTFLIMTFINPFRIFSVGMQLSFLAILGISGFSKKIYNFFESKTKWNIKNKCVIKILCFIAKVVSTSLSVNLIIFPIIINSFNKFSLLFILSSLVVSILSNSIIMLGIISIILYKIPCISTILFSLLNFLLKLLINTSNAINNINVIINFKSIPMIIVIIYYLYILNLYILNKVRFKSKLIKKYLSVCKKHIMLILTLSICFIYIYDSFFNNYIYYFNVGQGEMAYIHKNKSNILIDSGSTSNDTFYIFDNFATKQNIKSVDAIIISHFHSDHINGLIKIIEKYKIKYLIYSYPYDMNNKEYTKFIDKIKNQKIKHIIVNSNDNIKVDAINIYILFPNKSNLNVSNKLEENENANSLVTNIKIKGKNYLFAGDSVKESEKYILNNLKSKKITNIEIIKIAHHGSRTSTSDKYIKYLKPKYAIISAKKSIYNHPNNETLETLNKYNVKTFITEKIGGIKYII